MRLVYTVWHELASLHMAAQRLEIAEIYIVQALAQLDVVGPATSNSAQVFYTLKGDLHRLQQRYAEAEEAYRHAQDIARPAGHFSEVERLGRLVANLGNRITTREALAL